MLVEQYVNQTKFSTVQTKQSFKQGRPGNSHIVPFSSCVHQLCSGNFSKSDRLCYLPCHRVTSVTTGNVHAEILFYPAVFFLAMPP